MDRQMSEKNNRNLKSRGISDKNQTEFMSSCFSSFFMYDKCQTQSIESQKDLMFYFCLTLISVSCISKQYSLNALINNWYLLDSFG